jgi:hypothetical protein
MIIIFHPMLEGMPYLGDLRTIPEFEDGSYLKIGHINAVPEYRAVVHLMAD